LLASCDAIDQRDLDGADAPDAGPLVEIAPVAPVPVSPGDGPGGEIPAPLPFNDGRPGPTGSGDAGLAQPDAAVLGVSCVAGESVCLSSIDAVECSAAGEWSAPVPCENACVEGRCGGECSPGAEE
jgi:hypothetical protein